MEDIIWRHAGSYNPAFIYLGPGTRGEVETDQTPGGGEAPGQREQPLARMLLLAHMAPRPALGIIHWRQMNDSTSQYTVNPLGHLHSSAFFFTIEFI